MARRRVTDAGRDAAEDVRFHVVLCQRGSALFDGTAAARLASRRHERSYKAAKLARRGLSLQRVLRASWTSTCCGRRRRPTPTFYCTTW